MGSVEPIAPMLEPLRKSVTVGRTPEDAFALFTAGLHRWWPLQRFSIGQERAVSCAIEERVGGEIYEVRDDGARFPWGRLLAWEPPRRLVMTWHPGRDPETAQEVEVRFVPEGAGTRVELEHRGWQSFGEGAGEAREGYDTGWGEVLGSCYGRCAGESAA